MDGSASKTAFVLAGGGSLGAVQVGMLETLVDQGISADLVVGASVGAVNGAYFAVHPDAEGVQGLERIWRGFIGKTFFRSHHLAACSASSPSGTISSTRPPFGSCSSAICRMATSVRPRLPFTSLRRTS